MRVRYDIINKKEQIMGWVNENKPKAYICQELKCKPLTLDMYLRKWGIKYNGNQGRKGNVYPERRISALEYMQKESVNVPTLRILLIRDGLKEAKCENPKCGIVEWMGEPAPLELHHKDGNHYNNTLSNLEILCSNCHSVADKQVIKPKKEKKQCKPKPKKRCECGALIELSSQRCFKCETARKRNYIVRPALTDLLNDVRIMGYRKTGKKYGVSHATIRRWIEYYENK